MTERLSKAERDVCRKRWEHPCDLEPERHACTIIDLLNDLDALEQELGQARKTRRCMTHGDVDGAHQWGCPECVRELRQELEQAAAREALLCEELKKCNHNYLQMGCLKKKELCAPCSLIDNTSEAARALLEIKWKWDWFNSDAISGGDLSRIAAITDERDTLRRERDALGTALRGLREAVRHMDIACATDDPLGVVQVNACNEADDALRDAEGSDEEA